MSRKITFSFADPKGVLLESPAGMGYGILAEGTAVPTDATAGYEEGCIFIVRSGSGVSTLYRNEGTQASCAFKRLLSVTDVGSVDLTALVATAAELNRTAHPATRLVAGGASLTVTQALHDGKTILLDTAAGTAVTLPAMSGSGSRFRFVCTVTNSGGSTVITATGAHLFGSLNQNNDTAQGTGFQLPAVTNAGGSTVITLDGTTKGGRKGDWIEIEDVASGIGIVRGQLNASGTEATPFS